MCPQHPLRSSLRCANPTRGSCRVGRTATRSLPTTRWLPTATAAAGLPAPTRGTETSRAGTNSPRVRTSSRSRSSRVNPAPASSSNGCLKAFLIVFAISMVLGIIVVVGSIFLVGKAVDDVAKSFGVADAADYDLPSGDIKCSVDDVTGAMKASGTLTNKKAGSPGLPGQGRLPRRVQHQARQRQRLHGRSRARTRRAPGTP